MDSLYAGSRPREKGDAEGNATVATDNTFQFKDAIGIYYRYILATAQSIPLSLQETMPSINAGILPPSIKS